MGDRVAGKSQTPVGKSRAIQRCPNCDIRWDVSLFVEGSLARCGHCGVRFEVHREASVPPPRPPPPAETPRAVVTPEPPLPRLEGSIVLEGIGVGGMGGGFRGSRDSDGRLVAVKILTRQMAPVPDYVRRFGRG